MTFVVIEGMSSRLTTANSLSAGIWSITVPLQRADTCNASLLVFMAVVVVLFYFYVEYVAYECLADVKSVLSLLEIVCLGVAVNVVGNFVYAG